ncbi:MAG: 1-acyl-sn-glycerol-3-phosphate acyltransferase [Spirochaetia bacterium]|nr:1-acyl-sn-glycerol-3-phosphate acyltransferase [Spirochaetia bacterium]
MAAVQSTLYWAFVGITSIALFPIALVIRVFTALFDKRLVVLHGFTCFWASLYTWLSPAWNVKVHGREKVTGKRYVMVSNHASMVDILVMFRLFRHFKWVSKSENFKIPFIGWNMRMNKYIEIKRGSVKGGDRMMKDCEATLKEDSSIMIFPEGTRSETGEMRPFKRGAFELAMRTDTPVLPIVIRGSARALPKRGVIFRGRHNITIEVLDPILPERFASMTPDELSDMTRNVMATALAGA